MGDRDNAEQIRIRGSVQGVGFRPMVWRLANDCQLLGAVWNDAEGVLIHAVGSPSRIDRLIELLNRECPPLATIDQVERDRLLNWPDYSDFRIIESRGGVVQTGIVPDAATCPACLADITDPTNRRFRYPFTNCTHCGPRLSIVSAIPYDRVSTSMAKFQQCPACLSEYRNPADRRFHAQPNACPDCGPRVWLEDAAGPVPVGETDPIQQTADLIGAGAIVAIKGIGGIHLACDATNGSAVASLRARKKRYHKAFALMASDLKMIRRYTAVSGPEAALLLSPAAPIVILDQLQPRTLPDCIAPQQNSLGFMLPYTPLHHLLMMALERPIVLTSGNRSDEPQVIDNEKARRRLADIADYWLLHDRDIVNRLDDSVVRVMDGEARLLRRARGYAPAPLEVPAAFRSVPPILAMGGELKSTFCLLSDGKAILSQHLGDLENVPTLNEYQQTLALYRQLFAHDPAILVLDRHPNYLSTQHGQRLAGDTAVQLERVQHHHAHVAACMAEQGVAPEETPVLGIALDGLGMGEAGALWGGEFLKVDYCDTERLACFRPVSLPGGAKAMYEPWRNTLAHLLSVFSWETLVERYATLDIIRFLQNQPIANLQQMLDRGLNSPPASSCGRLFDAVAAAIGICRERVSHEGQAAIAMEALLDPALPGLSSEGYGYAVDHIDGCRVLSWRPLWQALLEDLKQGLDAATIAGKFHMGLIKALEETARELCQQHRLNTVVLSGGVFQNRILLAGVSNRLRERGLRVLSPIRTPANDGGISLGQAVVAAARYRRQYGPG